MKTWTTQPLPRYSQYTVRLMAPRVWRTMASVTQALWPTFGNHRIYQLQPAETESAPNVIRLLLAETECPPKVPIYPHSAPKPKPKPKFGRPLYDTYIHRHKQTHSFHKHITLPGWSTSQLQLLTTDENFDFFTSTNTHWWCRPNGLKRQQIEQYQQRC